MQKKYNVYMGNPLYTNHREYIKNKFKKEALEQFSDKEILELLLTFSIPQKDIKDVALGLIKHFGSLPKIFDANDFEFKDKGLDQQSILFIKFIRGIITRYCLDKIKHKRTISNKEELYDYCITNLRNKKQEYFEVLFLTDKFKLIATEIIAEGNIDSASISPRKLLNSILAYDAKRIICVHNHPSGDPSPSKEDINMTEQLEIALQNISVKLIDHLIIGSGKIYSLCNKKYLEKSKILL